MKTRTDYPNLKDSVLLLVAILLVVFVLTVVGGFIEMAIDVPPLAAVPVLTIIVNSAALGAAIYFAIRKNPDLRRILVFRKPVSVVVVFLLVITGFGLSAVLSEIDNLMRALFPRYEAFSSLTAAILAGGSFLPTLIALVVVAPVTEELLFRGVIQRGLLKHYSPRWALVFTAILFGLFHLNPAQIFSAFVTGLVLGWLALRSGELSLSLILHAVINFFPALFLRINQLEIPGYSALDSPERFQPVWFDLLGAALLTLGLVGLSAYFRAEKDAEVTDEEVAGGGSGDPMPPDQL